MQEIRVNASRCLLAQLARPTCVHESVTPKLDGQSVGNRGHEEDNAQETRAFSKLLRARVSVQKTRVQI